MAWVMVPGPAASPDPAAALTTTSEPIRPGDHVKDPRSVAMNVPGPDGGALSTTAESWDSSGSRGCLRVRFGASAPWRLRIRCRLLRMDDAHTPDP